MPTAPALLTPFGRRLLIGLLALLDFAVAVVKRPSQLTHHLDFEGLSTTCDFSAAPAILKDEYTTRLVTFSGPGFGGLNGGVAMDRCALSSGNFPPLNNASVAGTGFLGFSTLHAFVGRTGKPISPETVRFDVRMTNILASFSGLDGHSVTIELWSGPGDSFDDEGELLQANALSMNLEGTQHRIFADGPHVAAASVGQALSKAGRMETVTVEALRANAHRFSRDAYPCVHCAYAGAVAPVPVGGGSSYSAAGA